MDHYKVLKKLIGSIDEAENAEIAIDVAWRIIEDIASIAKDRRKRLTTAGIECSRFLHELKEAKWIQ